MDFVNRSVVFLKGGSVQNFLYLYFAFSFKRSSSILQIYMQLTVFQILSTVSIRGLVEEISLPQQVL